MAIASMIGGFLGKAGADANANAAMDAAAQQREATALARRDMSPWQSAGSAALDEVVRLLGLGNLATDAGGTTYLNPDGREYGQAVARNRFQTDPDYQFRLAEGEKGLNRSLAARTGVLSGAAVKEGMRFNQGMAASAYGDYFNRLMGVAGAGQSAASATGQMGIAGAKAVGDNLMRAGEARQSGYNALASGVIRADNNAQKWASRLFSFGMG